MHAYPSLIRYLVHIQSDCIMISFGLFSIHTYISFPYNSFSRSDQIDSYNVDAISTDIELRILWRPKVIFHLNPMCIFPLP